MPIATKHSKKELTPERLTQLQNFIDRVKTGKIVPFKEKTERAKKNLKKAGLIK